MADLPAMTVWGDAYMGDTRHLSLEEHGAYWLLLLIAWRSPNQAIPDDDRRIAQMLGITRAKWLKLKPVVMAFWTLEPHGWTQKRQKKEWEFAQELREKRRSAANARWASKSLEDKEEGHANAYAHAYPNADASADAPIPIPTTVEDKPLQFSPSSRRKAKRALPHDWRPLQPGPTGAAAMIERNWNEERREREIEAFKAHHGSRANVMANWQQAWTNWVLNSEKFGGRTNGAGTHDDGRDRTTAAAEAAFGPSSGWSDDRPF